MGESWRESDACVDARRVIFEIKIIKSNHKKESHGVFPCGSFFVLELFVLDINVIDDSFICLNIRSVVYFYVDILIVVSEIFAKECQTTNVFGWFIYLKTEDQIILRGKGELLCVNV